MSDSEIFVLASECESLFQKALAAALGSTVRLYRALLDCHQRFEVWAGFAGAFAEEQASLDRRLKFSTDLQAAVIRLLSLITVSLRRGKLVRCNVELATTDICRPHY